MRVSVSVSVSVSVPALLCFPSSHESGHASQVRATAARIINSRRAAAAASQSSDKAEGHSLPDKTSEMRAAATPSSEEGDKDGWERGLGGSGALLERPLPLLVEETGPGHAVRVSEEEVAAVRRVAGGRVWTGEQALEVSAGGKWRKEGA